MPCLSIMPQAMIIRMPASAAMGMYAASGASSSTATRVITPESAPAKRVRAPATKLTALRVNEPLPGMPEKSPAEMLASPWATNSRLPSTCSPRAPARVLAMDSASTTPSRAMASAGMNRSRMTCASGAGGSEKGGSPAGMAPTTFTPCAPRSSAHTATPDATTARNAAGRRRRTRAMPRATAMANSPVPSAHGLVWGRWRRVERTSSRNVGALPMLTPSRFLSCPTAMSTAAPAVKPTITEWEMKCTSSPSRASPMTTWSSPARMATPNT